MAAGDITICDILGRFSSGTASSSFYRFRAPRLTVSLEITICDFKSMEQNGGLNRIHKMESHPSLAESRIHRIRGQRVMLDADLAEIYGAETKRLNEQVRRNPGRFPGDFMFRLTASEKAEVVAKCDRLMELFRGLNRMLVGPKTLVRPDGG